jgi:hypothetical protein
MRNIYSKCWPIVLLLLLAPVLSTSASAQTCLGVDACLLSPTRGDAGLPLSVNGCSVPPEAGPIGQFWAGVFEPACNQHDADWGTFNADLFGWFTASNAAFHANMLAICQARVDIPASECLQAANIFVFAVSATSIGQNSFKRAQYFASSCACRQLPTAPANLMAEVTTGTAGAQVTLEWTPGADATSYVVEVVQPALAPIDTRSPLPMFVATGVPSGQYRVQVRAANPLGVSDPSSVADIVVAPCATPLAPLPPTATFVGGVASVRWQAVAGATSYVVQAGSQSGASNIFNGNVGNTTTVSAAGLPAGFHAFVRVLAVNACGVSAASPEVEIGGSAYAR